MRDIRDDPDLERDAAVKVMTDCKLAVYQQKMNLFFSLMFGERGSDRVVISRSFLAKRLGVASLSKEDEEYFLLIFKYIRNYYDESPVAFPPEERDFLLRIFSLRWRLGAPASFVEFVRRVNFEDTSGDPLPIDSLI